MGNYTDTSFTLTCRAPENGTRLKLELYDATMNNRSVRSFWTTGPAQMRVGKLKPATDYLVVVRALGETFDTFVRTLAPAQTLKDRPGTHRLDTRSIVTLRAFLRLRRQDPVTSTTRHCSTHSCVGGRRHHETTSHQVAGGIGWRIDTVLHLLSGDGASGMTLT